jgi:Tol biopolymer transport system component
MRRLIVLLSVAVMPLLGLVVVGGPAQAKYPGANGQIAFGRPDPATGEPRIFIANPDGTHERQLPLPLPADNATWSPSGDRLLVMVFRPDAPVRPATVNPDGSGFTVLDVPQLPPDIDMGCRAWSPDATRLLCQAIRFGGDPSLNGIYTIRAADGGGLTRLTVNPYPPTGNFGGGDIPGDYSPDGTRFVFMRAKPGAGPVPDRNQSGALFVENSDGTGLRQITPYGLANSHDNGLAHWSPDGSEILFASVNGPFGHASLFVIHPDGTGLRPIPLDTGGSFSVPFTPGWSPDGMSIVFSLFLGTTGQVDIYTARSDGTRLAQVTNTPDFEDFADWGTRSWPAPQIEEVRSS